MIIFLLLPALPAYGQIKGTSAQPVAVRLTVSGNASRSHKGQRAQDASKLAIERTRRLIEEVRAASYPELDGVDIEVKIFDHEADYFRTAFSFSRFLFIRKMRIRIKVNPKVFELGAPEEGVRAIIAHELGHALYFKKGNRIRLFGLVRLISKGYTARFERWTDLQAISRGYAEGLRRYREWLYKNVPAEKLEEKKRNYFSPEEIDSLRVGIERKPGLLDYWLKHVPRNLKQIESQLQTISPQSSAFSLQPSVSGLIADN